MVDPTRNVYYASMPQHGQKTDFPISFFATPSALDRELFYTIFRAGHLRAAPNYGVKRDRFHGFEFIYCLSGQARVRVEGQWHAVAPGDLVVFDCHHPHEHKTGTDDPWQAYWVRIEGPRLERMCSILAIAQNPVIHINDDKAIRHTYSEIFTLLASEETQKAPKLHAALANLIAQTCAAHQLPPQEAPLSPKLQAAVNYMRQNYFEVIRVENLAARTGLSPSQFNRLFRQAYNTSPIDWLRHERINQAKRRLAETTDPIEWIATQVGYQDRFFFSKDFKRMTGLTPRDFRRRES